MVSFIVKSFITLTCTMVTGIVGFAFYSSVKESFDYDIQWRTALRDSHTGVVSHVDMAPVDIQGNTIVFKDHNNNRVYYSGDYISSRVEAKIKSDSRVGRVIMSTFGEEKCKWLVQDKLTRVNEVIATQEGIAKAFMKVQSLIQTKEDLSHRLADLDKSIPQDPALLAEHGARKKELESKIKAVDEQLAAIHHSIKKAQKEMASLD